MGRGAPLIVAAAFAALGCDQTRRPQLVVTVSSDLVLPDQLAADATLSPAASLHRVRVEVYGPSVVLEEAREFVLGDAQSFPLGFGVAPAEPGGQVSLRIIGYRSGWTTGAGDARLPSSGVAVDRLFTTGVTGVERIELVLRGDCLGLPANLTERRTCIDGARPAFDADGSGDAQPATPGSWSEARAMPCTGSAPVGTVCIPGGVSSLGDPALSTVDAFSDLVPAPPRMAVLSPFYLDEEEMTVAALRALATAGALPGPLPSSASGCNFTLTRGAADEEAVRCVPFGLARAACLARGGDLPTAAQWEHAARGRGRDSRYPWGDAPPTCCAAALAAGPLGCSPSRRVGSHADPALCAGLADRSRDGVLDLGGGVREWVLDAAVSVDDCLAPGLLRDPRCAEEARGPGSTKGGSTDTPLEGATLALRRSGEGEQTSDIGFRCVRR